MTSRTSTPSSAGRSSRPRCAGRTAGAATQAISSPVSSTKTSSRFAGAALAVERAGRRWRRRAAAARPRCRCAACAGPAAGRLALDLGEPRRRPVDLERLAPGVLAHQLVRRAGGDGLAVRHDRHAVGEPLGLLDVVRRHQDRDALGAQRVDQRPQLLADLRVEADGRLVEQDEPRPVHQRAGDQQPAAHAARQLVDARVAPVAEVRDLAARARSRSRARSRRAIAVEVA